VKNNKNDKFKRKKEEEETNHDEHRCKLVSMSKCDHQV
jgi:hypothetical protein